MGYVRPVTRLRTIAGQHGIDALIVLAAAGSAVEVAVRNTSRASTWLAVPAVALVVLPLLGRRRYPFGAPAAVWLVAASASFADGRLIPTTATAVATGLAAAFLLGRLRDASQARVGLAITVGAAAIVVHNDPTHTAGDYTFIPLLFAIGWIAGFALRERAEEAERAELRATHAESERESSARVAVAEERARIARELHDIVAHSVSVMVLQVGAVRHKLVDAAQEDRDALADVERTGRTALAEMRRLLGAMRRDDERVALAPRPGLGDLRTLLEQIGRAGLPVRLHVDGEPRPLPEALDLSAYRIVQEGLTNTLKHSGASRADVIVRYGHGELRLEVRDDGAGTAVNDGLGHGLVGVRERVNVYGGEMTADTTSDGGFVLSACLPLSDYRS